jgi:hypothetical protein
LWFLLTPDATSFMTLESTQKLNFAFHHWFGPVMRMVMLRHLALNVPHQTVTMTGHPTALPRCCPAT